MWSICEKCIHKKLCYAYRELGIEEGSCSQSGEVLCDYFEAKKENKKYVFWDDLEPEEKSNYGFPLAGIIKEGD